MEYRWDDAQAQKIAIESRSTPGSEELELLVYLRLPEGASFEATLREARRLEKTLAGRPEIDHWVDFVGAGAPRFYLPLNVQLTQPNFAQFVITEKSVDDRAKLERWLASTLRNSFPAVRTRVSPLETGPSVGYPVQFRVSGSDLGTVREIAEKVAATMKDDARTTGVHFDWDEPGERSVRFEIDQQKARGLGITSEAVASFLAISSRSWAVSCSLPSL